MKMKKILNTFFESYLFQRIEDYVLFLLFIVEAGAVMWMMGVVILTDFLKKPLKRSKIFNEKMQERIIRFVLLLTLLALSLFLPSWWKLVPGCILIFGPTLLSVLDLIRIVFATPPRRQRYNSWEF